MRKTSVGRQSAKPAFRESDFAGMRPQEQAELIGSLNQLSQQLAATRQLLRDLELGTPDADPLAPTALAVPGGMAPEPPSSDDDSAVPK
jgi:hypothetical protein